MCSSNDFFVVPCSLCFSVVLLRSEKINFEMKNFLVTIICSVLFWRVAEQALGEAQLKSIILPQMVASLTDPKKWQKMIKNDALSLSIVTSSSLQMMMTISRHHCWSLLVMSTVHIHQNENCQRYCIIFTKMCAKIVIYEHIGPQFYLHSHNWRQKCSF